jgi:hypothetical protein
MAAGSKGREGSGRESVWRVEGRKGVGDHRSEVKWRAEEAKPGQQPFLRQSEERRGERRTGRSKAAH